MPSRKRATGKNFATPRNTGNEIRARKTEHPTDVLGAIPHEDKECNINMMITKAGIKHDKDRNQNVRQIDKDQVEFENLILNQSKWVLCGPPAT